MVSVFLIAIFFVLCGAIFELNYVLLSTFKGGRFVHPFQPFLFGYYVGFDLHYHRCKFFLALLSCLGVDIMRFTLAISVSWTVSALEEVGVYHRHTACAGFAAFGLVRLEIGLAVLSLPVLKRSEFRRLCCLFVGLSSPLASAWCL